MKEQFKLDIIKNDYKKNEQFVNFEAIIKKCNKIYFIIDI